MTGHNIFDELRNLRTSMVQEINSEKHYQIIDYFDKTSDPAMKIAAQDMSWSGFRSFDPYKPSSGRMLNSCYGQQFDPKSHTLMDYATIVSGKLGGSWNAYNHLISVQIAGCPLHCWHCYVDECLLKSCGRCVLQDANMCKQYGKGGKPNATAKIIIDAFLDQRQIDASKTPALQTNILRITGGEPFLVPDLILESLNLLAEKQLSKIVYLWTETNLIPLLHNPDTNKPFAEEWGLNLAAMAQYNNFSIHPCIHGLNADFMERVTGHRIALSELLNALKLLIASGIDIYPSFISNVNPPEEIPNLFHELLRLDANLPLRFALVKHDDYPPVQERLKAFKIDKRDLPKTYDHSQAIEIWNGLLEKTFGVSYAQIPRHIVPLGSCSSLRTIGNNSDASTWCFFKSTYRPEYKEAFVSCLSLPNNWRFSVPYDLKHLAPDIANKIVNGNKSWGINSIFVFLDRHIKKGDSQWARRFMPIRNAILEDVEYFPNASWAMFHFRLKELLLPSSTWERSSDEIASRVVGGILPGEDNPYYVVPFPDLVWTQVDVGNTLHSWENIINGLSKIEEFQPVPFLRLHSLTDEEGDEIQLKEPISACAGQTYTLSFVSYVPVIESYRDKVKKTAMVSLSTDSHSIIFQTPSSLLVTKYGSHKASFVCTNSLVKRFSSISMTVDTGEAKSSVYFHLPFVIKKNIRSVVFYIALAILGLILTTTAWALDGSNWKTLIFIFKVWGGVLPPIALLLFTLRYSNK